MIGDFQYQSSSSDESNSECESDSGESDNDMNKLEEERNRLQGNIQDIETKLGTIQKILKRLNNERKELLEKRNKLISSVSGEEDLTSGAPLATSASSQEIGLGSSSMAVQNPFSMSTNSEPLNLNVCRMTNCDNEEEFDSEDDL